MESQLYRSEEEAAPDWQEHWEGEIPPELKDRIDGAFAPFSDRAVRVLVEFANGKIFAAPMAGGVIMQQVKQWSRESDQFKDALRLCQALGGAVWDTRVEKVREERERYDLVLEKIINE